MAFFQNENDFPILESFGTGSFQPEKGFFILKALLAGPSAQKRPFSKRVGILFARGRHHGSYPL
jgi:hypothetical protein